MIAFVPIIIFLQRKTAISLFQRIAVRVVVVMHHCSEDQFHFYYNLGFLQHFQAQDGYIFVGFVYIIIILSVRQIKACLKLNNYGAGLIVAS